MQPLAWLVILDLHGRMSRPTIKSTWYNGGVAWVLKQHTVLMVWLAELAGSVRKWGNVSQDGCWVYVVVIQQNCILLMAFVEI